MYSTGHHASLDDPVHHERHCFVVIEATIPGDMTIAQWRTARAAGNRSSRRWQRLRGRLV
jgi:hypothetical protein